MEAVIEAELLEKELNNGLTFGEAEAAQIQIAREHRDPLITAGLKNGAYMVTVQTLHGASQMPGFARWSKRIFVHPKPAAKSPKRTAPKSSSR